MQFCIVYAKHKLNIVLKCSLNGTSKDYWKIAERHYRSRMMRPVNRGKTGLFLADSPNI